MEVLPRLHPAGIAGAANANFIRHDDKRQYGPSAVYCQRLKRTGAGNRTDQFREHECVSNVSDESGWRFGTSQRTCSGWRRCPVREHD